MITITQITNSNDLDFFFLPILPHKCKHGNFKVNKLVKKAVGIKTLQLAATRLTIPLEGRATTFQIPLPPHMEEALSVLSNPQ